MTPTMPDEMEIIDRYVSGLLTGLEREAIERRIASDPLFADEVAFHLSALAVAREAAMEEAKVRFRTIHSGMTNGNDGKVRVVIMPLIRRMAAAAAVVLLAGLAWLFFLRAPSPHTLAQEYIKKELSGTGVNMGTDQDALATARESFNSGDLQGAAKTLDSLVLSDAANADAKKMSGIVSLRLGDHDKALSRFRELAAIPGLYANPGKFLEAVTLMDRNATGDKEKARQALDLVVRGSLGGHEQADAWLKKF